MDNLRNRVIWARKRIGYSLDELADLAKVSHATVAHLESGRAKTSRNIFELAAALDVDAMWLARGVGQWDAHKERNRQQESMPAIPAREVLYLDEAELNIVDSWRMANEDAKSLFGVACAMARRHPASIKREA